MRLQTGAAIVSTYKSIFIDGKEVFSFRNEFHPETVYYFPLTDLRNLSGVEAIPYTVGAYAGPCTDDPEDLDFPVFMATAGVVRERLEVLGYGEILARRLYELLLPGFFPAEVDEEGNRGDPLTVDDWPFDAWMDDVKDHIHRKRQFDGDVDAMHLRDLGPLMVFEDMDERMVLRVILSSVEDSAQVAVDVAELVDNSWLDTFNESEDDDLGSADLNKDRGTGPPIIIAEGTFDAWVLSNSIALLRPHLMPFIRFLDYDRGAEGGAAAVVRTLKAFAAAGIANRIVALFDNDSAAYEAVMALRDTRLPNHYRVIHYPDLTSATDYPTLGPQGQATMDVNRLAGSIELYLGDDVLRDPSGQLRPVQWKGFMGKIKSYQGEIVDKAAVQRTFRAKLEAAHTNHRLIASQDWSGIELILDRLVAEFGSF